MLLCFNFKWLFRELCHNLNARSGLHIGYKKEDSEWKKYDGSEVSDQFDFDWIKNYGNTGNHISLECYRKSSTHFGQLFDSSHNKPFICQYV